MSWRVVAVGVSLSVSMLGAGASTGCSVAEDGSGGEGGEGGNRNTSTGATGQVSGDVANPESGPGLSPPRVAQLDPPPYECAAQSSWQGFRFSPLAWGSMASAEYARAALASGALPDPTSLALDDFLARFAPPPGDTAAVAGGLLASDLSDPLKAQLDVTLFPAASELGVPSTHLVVVVDASQGMFQELPLASKVLRGLGTSLDESGDRLSVVRWSAANELVVERSLTPAASADEAAASLESPASQLPPSADLSTALEMLVGLVDGGPAHVVLLTDGGSPVEPSTVARLRTGGAVVSVIQLVGQARTGNTLPFAGTMLRSVALEGHGAALWMHETTTDLALLGRRFDAVFRRAGVPVVEVSAPYLLTAPTAPDPPYGTPDAPLQHGVGAPLRVVLDAHVCTPEFYAASAAETWWGRFAVDGGAWLSVLPDSRAQLQWSATRGVFEVLSAGCPQVGEPERTVPALTELLLLAQGDVDVQALATLLTDFTAVCAVSAGDPSTP